ncbi:hypothetical protein ACFLYO_02940, partial [Chloroflexota bacterium]
QTTGILLLIFKAEAQSRLFRDSAEGLLAWVPQKDVLTYDLVEDLPELLPRVLAMSPGDPPFFAHVSYDSADVVQVHFADVH